MCPVSRGPVLLQPMRVPQSQSECQPSGSHLQGVAGGQWSDPTEALLALLTCGAQDSLLQAVQDIQLTRCPECPTLIVDNQVSPDIDIAEVSWAAGPPVRTSGLEWEPMTSFPASSFETVPCAALSQDQESPGTCGACRSRKPSSLPSPAPQVPSCPGPLWIPLPSDQHQETSECDQPF